MTFHSYLCCCLTISCEKGETWSPNTRESTASASLPLLAFATPFFWVAMLQSSPRCFRVLDCLSRPMRTRLPCFQCGGKNNSLWRVSWWKYARFLCCRYVWLLTLYSLRYSEYEGCDHQCAVQVFLFYHLLWIQSCFRTHFRSLRKKGNIDGDAFDSVCLLSAPLWQH